jgi:hypothetical protein
MGKRVFQQVLISKGHKLCVKNSGVYHTSKFMFYFLMNFEVWRNVPNLSEYTQI